MRKRAAGMNARRSFELLVCVACAVLACARAGAYQIFTDTFDRASLGADYTTYGAGVSSIVNNKLRLDAAGVAAWGTSGVSTSASLFANDFTAGSFLKVDLNYYQLTRSGVNMGTNDMLYYRYYDSSGGATYTQGRSGFWNNGANTQGGSSQLSQSVDRKFAVLYLGDRLNNGQRTVLTFVQGPSNDVNDGTKWRYNTTFTSAYLDLPAGKVAKLGLQHGAAIASSDHTHYVDMDNLVVYNREIEAGGTAAIKSGLFLAYSQDFSAPLGSEWSFVNSDTQIQVTGGQLRVQTDLGANGGWDSAYANLNLTQMLNGRGLLPGEYVEVTTRREQNNGRTGYSLFGEQIRCQSLSGNQPLSVYLSANQTFGGDQGTADIGISPASFNWNAFRTLGMRLDYADGDFAVASFYVDGQYATSYLFDTLATSLNVFGLFGQANGNVSALQTLTFDDLRVYTLYDPAGIPEPASVALLALGLASLARRRRGR